MNYTKILKVIKDLTSDDLDALARGNLPNKALKGAFCPAREKSRSILMDLSLQEIDLLMKVAGDPDLLTLVEVAVDFEFEFK